MTNNNTEYSTHTALNNVNTEYSTYTTLNNILTNNVSNVLYDNKSNSINYTVNRTEFNCIPTISHRIDGRSTNEERVINITMGNESLLIRKYLETKYSKLYSTSIIIYKTIDIKKSSPDKSRLNTLCVNCNDKNIQTEIDKIFNNSKIFPDKLSLLNTQCVISIKLDIIIILDKGGLLEIITEGIFRALADINIQLKYKTELITKSVINYVQFYPVTVSCAVLKGEAIYDPSEEELLEASDRMVITYNKNIEYTDVIYWMFSGSIPYNNLKRMIYDTLCVK
ncbi:uncharacterized protein NEPG_01010 [Nematocida parisii ERTm1]|uniref:Uncharacterized protein n=1 Tax=Nematocida parisii (strain ERTm3) TaxID=935791 RepID=I3EJR4_NEMP3|nr:uncharacterized protein NEPG_01010 [Nematocida parisii ERTm1]EIJ89461.1 hypothetical protein NEQG_00231 [Nematocida parisii ERTm3]KAI5131535.1 hypothetical protein NEPAR03_2474 [Nematocida parisii]EIJ94342.1 hypothetical protein NEPG_01010 [Nematocida parisii ERTm1]KAI5131594.1 hypothetical protein NEPAR08_2518 [Nematocida parisii]KAI5146345.1 hypothetical protein NEPAR04_2589 [Nematocida parisii]|eukprot:XP_013058838.1 hypothetical protein NEPG_01010 [Nematocida parisii ERTm1]